MAELRDYIGQKIKVETYHVTEVAHEFSDTDASFAPAKTYKGRLEQVLDDSIQVDGRVIPFTETIREGNVARSPHHYISIFSIKRGEDTIYHNSRFIELES